MVRQGFAAFIFMAQVFFFAGLCGAVEAPRNPNSAKECALCHYRWIDTFFIDGKGTDLVPYQEEKVAAKAEICFSCHDGSVVDSRVRVYNDHHHPIDKPPPAGMVIPSIFPLDKKGNMQCATCHTAHGVSSEMGMEKTIFLRVSNTNSEMCRMCHTNKAGGPESGNHPLDSTKLKISANLKEHGAEEGAAKNQVICQSCHTAHGSPFDKFLVETTANSTLCLNCHKDKQELINSPHDLRKSAPQAKNSKGQTTAQSGICGACHRVHGAQKVALWSRQMAVKESEHPVEDLCLSCHNEKGVAHKILIKGHSHPIHEDIKKKGLSTTLPTFNKWGRRVLKNGIMSCPTCHDPHRIRKNGDPATKKEKDHFLRMEAAPSSTLCKDCHADEKFIEKTDHDLRLTSPDAKNKKGQRPVESGLCGVCHQIHGGQEYSLWARNSFPEAEGIGEKACLGCHSNNGVAAKKSITSHSHPLNVGLAKAGLETTLPLFDKAGHKDKSGKISCTTCHNPHRWDPLIAGGQKSAGDEGTSRNSFLRLTNAPSSQLCEDCHADKVFIEKTDHDLNVTASAFRNSRGQTPAESGVCGSCHSPHNEKSRPLLWTGQIGSSHSVMDRLCTGCHSENGIASNKVPLADSHPEDKLVTNIGRNVKGKPNYFPLYHRETGKLVTVGDISCPSCHDVHQWDPKRKEKGKGKNLEGRTINSFLRMQTYKIMCVDCHGMDALFRFKYYHDSTKRKKQRSTQ